MKPTDKLRAWWSKRERDVMLYHPLGFETKRDANFLSGVFGKEFTKELDERGYDLATLRFSIAPKPGNERFASQRKQPPPCDNCCGSGWEDAAYSGKCPACGGDGWSGAYYDDGSPHECGTCKGEGLIR